jgi:hypothetical protein
MNNIATVFRRFHGTRCIISNMNNGRDVHAFNQLVNEANRQKLEARIISLENTVKQLSEKVKTMETKSLQSINMVQDYKHVN